MWSDKTDKKLLQIFKWANGASEPGHKQMQNGNTGWTMKPWVWGTTLLQHCYNIVNVRNYIATIYYNTVDMRNYIVTIYYNTVNMRNYTATICYNTVKVENYIVTIWGTIPCCNSEAQKMES